MENLVKFGDNYLALQSIEHSKNVGLGHLGKYRFFFKFASKI